VSLGAGPLWPRVVARSSVAASLGAIKPIETETRIVEEADIRFLVRFLAGRDRKQEARKLESAAHARAGRDPFLPYDEALFVANLSATHVCLLNKFNVLPHHVLMVTREFEEQRALLTPADISTMAACLSEVDGLAFYNAGAAAGASQPHKHLQFVPLPLGREGPRVPIEPLIVSARLRDAVGRVAALPFAHALARLHPSADPVPKRAARTMLARYRDLVAATGIGASDPTRPAPYNLLATREWMLLVPRSREHWASISVNALGFAGSLFVRDEHQLAVLRERGPMTLLRRVATPAARQSSRPSPQP